MITPRTSAADADGVAEAPCGDERSERTPSRATTADSSSSSSSSRECDGDGDGDGGPSSSSSSSGRRRRRSHPRRRRHRRVLAFYKFTPVPPGMLASLREEVESTLRRAGARGCVLLAEEGVNGTVCYPFPPRPMCAASTMGEVEAEEEAAEAEEEAEEEADEGEGFGGAEDGDRGHRADEGDDDRDDPVLLYLRTHPIFGGCRALVGRIDGGPAFQRLKVKVKREIVTMGEEGRSKRRHSPAAAEEDGDGSGDGGGGDMVNPTRVVGRYVAPRHWDALLEDPDVAVIDVRNGYEVEIGTFEGAIDPRTSTFAEFPAWLRWFASGGVGGDDGNDGDGDAEWTTARRKKPPKAVAMFCTGGIRCEKATSYALSSGIFPPDVPVYHLEGGILAYLDSVIPESKSKWMGECFVFDRRVAVGQGLEPSVEYAACRGCRRPVLREEREGDYVEGVCCRRCRGELTEKQVRRFQERQRQCELAEKGGVLHMHDPKERNGSGFTHGT